MSFRVDGLHVLKDLRMVEDAQDFALVSVSAMMYLIAYLAVLVSLSSSTTLSANSFSVLFSMHLYTIENLPVPITSVVM